ncbi:MAG: ATP synthase F1 subunit delta [Archangium sp.]|nr:ATP synthase F1 subunit delta [Archangium sp.]
MQNVSIARRYARALLEAAGPKADEVLSQLDALVAYYQAHPEAWSIAASPVATRDQRMTVVGTVLRFSTNPNETLVNTLKLLVDRNRFSILPDVARQFRDLVDVRLGRVRGKVTSATPLGEAHVAAIKQSLEKLTQRQVMLEQTVDRSVLGGVVASVGSKTYDGSLRNQLSLLGQHLTATR